MSDWGYQTATASAGTVTGTNGTVLAANASRKYLRISNTGGTAGYFNFGGAAAVNAGIRINGAGTPPTYYEMSVGLGNLNTAELQGILTVAGTAQFAILEGV